MCSCVYAMCYICMCLFMLNVCSYLCVHMYMYVYLCEGGRVLEIRPYVCWQALYHWVIAFFFF